VRKMVLVFEKHVSCIDCRFLLDGFKDGKMGFYCTARAWRRVSSREKKRCVRFLQKTGGPGKEYINVPDSTKDYAKYFDVNPLLDLISGRKKETA